MNAPSASITTRDELRAITNTGTVIRAAGHTFVLESTPRGLKWQRDGRDDQEFSAEAVPLPAVIIGSVPPRQTLVAVVHFGDVEDHAAAFNEGFDEAIRQSIGGAERRAWATGKVMDILRKRASIPSALHVHLGLVAEVAERIADAILSEADLTQEPARRIPAGWLAAATDYYGSKDWETDRAHCLDVGNGTVEEYVDEALHVGFSRGWRAR